jgi:hypothetical protein
MPDWTKVPRTEAQLRAQIQIDVTHEDIRLDFKSLLSPNLNNSDELALDVASFANTFGGILVFGVREAANANGFKVAKAITGVENAEDVKKAVAALSSAWLHPDPLPTCHFIPLAGSAQTVVVVEILPTPELIFVWGSSQRNVMKFVGRNDYGKFYLTVDEVHNRMNTSSRRAYLRLHEMVRPASSSDKIRIFSPVLTSRTESNQEVSDRAQRVGLHRPTNIAETDAIRSRVEQPAAGGSGANVLAFDEQQIRVRFFGNESHEIDIPLEYVDAVWRLTKDDNTAVTFRCTIVIPTGEPPSPPYLRL